VWPARTSLSWVGSSTAVLTGGGAEHSEPDPTCCCSRFHSNVGGMLATRDPASDEREMAAVALTVAGGYPF
jgi:hypothetical protein